MPMKKIPKFAATFLILLCAPECLPAQQKSISGADPNLSAASSGGLSAIPPLPTGKSTILGGSIRSVDPVLDRFTLNIVGEKPLRILFDERTQVFMDGKKMPLRDLRPAEHASVQTTLDGTSVFAISIHILSHLQQGAYTGEVASYNPSTGDLEMVSGMGGGQVRMRVPADTKFSRKGQGSFTSIAASAADLQKGSLVSIEFAPDGKGMATATEITLLATPGSQFVFSGNVISLDLHSGNMVLLDPRTNQSYQIEFAADRISALQNVHRGQQVRVTAEYNGAHYLAQQVAPY